MWQKIVIVIGIWYDDGFGFSDLDRIMFWAKFSDQDQIRILLKFFGADRIIKFQYPHNTAVRVIGRWLVQHECSQGCQIGFFGAKFHKYGFF